MASTSRALITTAAAMFLLAPAWAAPSVAEPLQRGAAPSYTLTAWTAQSGLLPGDVLAIAEDRDGYLWLGTSSGLERFDGAVFTTRDTRPQHSSAVDRAVSALVSARDGTLWVGHGGSGGIARIGGDEITTFSPDEGLFAGGVSVLVEDQTGTIWAGGRGGLSAFRHGRWARISSGRGLREASVYSIYEDRAGRLWLSTSAGIYASAQDRFELLYPDLRFVQAFAEDRHGTMWVTDTRETIKRLGASELPVHGDATRAPQSGWRMARDQHNQLWIAALGGGLLRLVDDGTGLPAIERFPYEQTIIGSPRSIFADRNGNLWIGMRGGGLLRVAENVIPNHIPLEGLTNDGVRAIRAVGDGSVWVATGHSLNRFAGTTREAFTVAQTRALDVDTQGTLWVATARGFGRIEHGRFQTVELAREIQWEGVMAVATDLTGAHWLCSTEGVMVWNGKTLTRFSSDAHMRGPCGSVYIDRRGRTWIGFTGGDVTLRHNGTTRRFDKTAGLAGGAVLSILEDRDGTIWIASTSGLSRFQDGQFTAITERNGPFSDVTAALVQDDEGALWLGVNSGAALIRINPREMDRVAANPSHNVEYALYDGSDGLQGEIAWQQSRALAARAADGRLWFATGSTLTVIDRHNLPATQRPTAPRIDAVWADGSQLATFQHLQLSSGVANLKIDWGAISLSAASKLRFRYRLEGRDPDWVYAGTRRSVSYAHLPSGRYRFRVGATNDGVWPDGAAWEFAVAPPVYLTGWFLSLCAAGMVAAVAAAWWLRVRMLQERYALVFAERALLSREIHDTLLQSLATTCIELETVQRQLDPRQTASLEALKRLQHQAAHAVGEARDLVVALRKTGLSKTPGLIETLREIASHTTTTRGTQVTLTVGGTPRRCSGDLELQLLRICQEAVNNAVVHGRASAIEILVEFSSREVRLAVTDNGCGFVIDDRAENADGKEHLGVIGMRERAERIRATFTINSRLGSGTTIEATAPIDGR